MEASERSERDSKALRELAVALGVAAAALPGALPVARGAESAESEPLFLFVWLALIAAPSGAACAALGLRAWPYGAAVVGAWSALATAIAGTSERVVPTPLWGVLCAGGLFVGGVGCGLALRRTWGAVGALAFVGLALSLMPIAPGILGTPWPSELASAALDAAPVSLVVEASGIDWMRTAGIYDPAGSDRLARAPWSGELAAPVCLVLGCALWGLGALLARARRPQGSHTP